MGTLKKPFGHALLILLGLTLSGLVCATPVTMDFDDFAVVPHKERVADYYNGGCSQSRFGYGSGTCGGPDYGVTWSDAIAGFSNRVVSYLPSSPNILTLSRRNLAIMNVAAGFGDSLSFYYFAITHDLRHRTGSISVYSGSDGTGNLLATEVLTPSNCSGRYVFRKCWNVFDIDFAGTAHSVVFNQFRRAFVGFDNVSLNVGPANVAVPEPPVLGMFGLALLLIALLMHQRRPNILRGPPVA
ncbi:MAG TPA: hypothetical protein VFJ15_05205 [Oleiagrimonas sp.]|nr:hypothetical protein [Oleiagrimonas sp.]